MCHVVKEIEVSPDHVMLQASDGLCELPGQVCCHSTQTSRSPGTLQPSIVQNEMMEVLVGALQDLTTRTVERPRQPEAASL